MPQLKQQILDFMSRPGYQPVKLKSLAKKLGIKKRNLPRFTQVVESLIEARQLHATRSGLLRPHAGADLLAGIVKRTARGAGIFLAHDVDRQGPVREVAIAASDMSDAHTGDEVLVRLLKRRRSGGQRCGRVEQVLQRATTQFVGTYFERSGAGYVQVDGRALTEPILVGDPGAKNAQTGDKVVIDMLRFPSQYQAGEAVLTRVLGPRGEPGVDEKSIICEFGLRDQFPDAAIEEAHVMADRFDQEPWNGRVDLTGETIVTIDPADARDFDDAISLTGTPDGHWHLGVHIADVAHFVKPGGLLDREAQRRGNSVYLPGRVLPMLPELISNGLASLQQGQTRFTKSVLIEFTAEGIPIHTQFANSVIKVTRRFAYEQVMPILREPDRFHRRVSAKVRKLLARMHELAMILRQRRFRAGALELQMPEVEIDFDKKGRVRGAHAASHDESHQIIEEFMLAANTAVAVALEDRGLLFLRRVHGDPSRAKLKTFAEFVKALGFSLERFQSRHDLQDLLDRVAGTPTEPAVNYALLRSMKQAEYSVEPEGHYALALEHYCHFTSPIRRYPDLTVHRLIGSLAAGRRRIRGPSQTELTRLGRHCSMMERRAEKAERELTRCKLLTFLEEQIGLEMDAIVTGVERFGLFCRGIDLPAEGMIHISWLSESDRFYYDGPSMSLIGWQTGRQFRLGDQLRVQVAHVDVDRREVDFRLAPSGKTSRSTRKTKGKSAPDRPTSSKKSKQSPAQAKGRQPRGGRRSASRRRS